MKAMTGREFFEKHQGAGLWAEQPRNVRLLFTILAAQEERLDQLDSDHGAELDKVQGEVRELEGRVEKLEGTLDDHMSSAGCDAHPI